MLRHIYLYIIIILIINKVIIVLSSVTANQCMRYMCMIRRLILANLHLIRTMEFAVFCAKDLIATVGGVSLERYAKVRTDLYN